MKYLKTTHERKSAVITTIITVLIVLLFFVLGLKYYDPPISYGMEVNFGTSSQGKGEVQPKKPAVAKPQIQAEQPIQKAPVSQPEPVKDIKAVTQEKSDVTLPEKTEDKPSEPIKEIPEEVVPPKPKLDDATKNILSNLVNQKAEEQSEQPKGEGDDTVAGDKGKLEGNPYANSYFNRSGPGGMGKGFGLNGRRLESAGKVAQECNQEGIVVVRITVNKEGDVILAEAGVKGTTNTHPCLLAPAEQTALLHKWHPDAMAPSKQVGFVVIQFKLGE